MKHLSCERFRVTEHGEAPTKRGSRYSRFTARSARAMSLRRRFPLTSAVLALLLTGLCAVLLTD